MKKLDRDAKNVKMQRLSKNAPATWWNGSESRYPQSDLDHVIASNHIVFKQIKGAQVDVRGWPALDSVEKQDQRIEDYSDHGLLYFEVQKVT